MSTEHLSFREALISDIPGIQLVRNSVTENKLSNPAVISDNDCEEYLTHRGNGWVSICGDRIVGFSIADLSSDNIWALFVNPEFERLGIGKKLQSLMLSWYFGQGKESVWLSTAPGTRAEQFYSKAGWNCTGLLPNGELRFEMTRGTGTVGETGCAGYNLRYCS